MFDLFLVCLFDLVCYSFCCFRLVSVLIVHCRAFIADGLLWRSSVYLFGLFVGLILWTFALVCGLAVWYVCWFTVVDSFVGRCIGFLDRGFYVGGFGYTMWWGAFDRCLLCLVGLLL